MPPPFVPKPQGWYGGDGYDYEDFTTPVSESGGSVPQPPRSCEEDEKTKWPRSGMWLSTREIPPSRTGTTLQNQKSRCIPFTLNYAVFKTYCY